jgi:hypothetical protein
MLARSLLAAATLGATATLLVACSSSDVLRPEIDVTQTAALVAPAPVASAPPVWTEPMPEPEASDVAPPQGPVDVASMRVLPPPSEDVPEVAPADIPQSAPVVQAAITPGPGLQRLVPSNPYMHQEPEYRDRNAAPGAMPRSESDCRRELKRLGATFQNLPSVGDGQYCGIDYPVKLSQLSGDIGIKPAATLSCQMALQVAKWTKYELGPSTRRRYFTGVKNIHQGSSYSCRKIRGSRTMSQHSKGNALDIMRIELDSGKKIGVRKPGFFAFREKGLLNNVRADACGYFSTVLGPGYDRDHKDHFHFDIAQRRNGRKACR